MATFNGERWLDEQLRSIRDQTRPPDEMVISDDGSSDRTREIAEVFAARAPFPTRVVSGPGRGLAENFWFAGRQSDCDLVAWCDQDDLWAPEKLAVCEEALTGDDAGLVSHSAQVVNASGVSLGRRYPDYRATTRRGPLEGDPWHVPSGFATVFRRRLLDCGAFARRPPSHQTNRTMNHDHAVSLLAFAAGSRIELREPLALYRQHGENAAGDPTPTGLDAVRETFRPRAAEFEVLGEVAEGYGRYLSVDCGVEPAGRYFADVARRCRMRAWLYGATGRRARLRRMSQAYRAHTYGPRHGGGFGARSLLRDLASGALDLS